MLTKFDWLRRCQSGAELLATLNKFSEHPDIDLSQITQGGPFSAIGRLCHRCRVYAPVLARKKDHRYCKICISILVKKKEVAPKSRRAIVIWGYVNQIPQHLRKIKPSNFLYGIYIHDEQRFLIMMQRQFIRQWLQELIIYSGTGLKGLIQIFPSLGEYRNLNMGDYLAWAIHHEANLSMDQLRIRFFLSPQQLINPKKQERDGLLTFDISEFISMLEMVEVFRANLRPHEQKELFELLSLDDPKEEQFYWGRFLGQLSQEAKDMLSAWKIRQWSKNQIKFFYKLIQYVILPQSS